MENIEKKNNGCGDSSVDKIDLEKRAFYAIMELPTENRLKIIQKYAEKYGIKLQQIISD